MLEQVFLFALLAISHISALPQSGHASSALNQDVTGEIMKGVKCPKDYIAEAIKCGQADCKSVTIKCKPILKSYNIFLSSGNPCTYDRSQYAYQVFYGFNEGGVAMCMTWKFEGDKPMLYKNWYDDVVTTTRQADCRWGQDSAVINAAIRNDTAVYFTCGWIIKYTKKP